MKKSMSKITTFEGDLIIAHVYIKNTCWLPSDSSTCINKTQLFEGRIRYDEDAVCGRRDDWV